MTAHWHQEKERIDAIRELKMRIEETRMEADRAERDADLQRAAELRYGALVELDRQLEAENAALDRAAARPQVPERGGHRGGRRRGRLEVDRHPGLEADGRRDAEARAPRGGPARTGRRPGRGRARRSRTRSADRAPGCPTRTARSARSCSWGRPASARPSWRRALADYLFDDERAIVRVDMSEYQERHAVLAAGGRAARLRRVRGRRPAHRGGAAAPVQRGAARRDGEGARRRVQHPAAAARRRPAHRRAGPHGRLPQRDRDHDVEPRVARSSTTPPSIGRSRSEEVLDDVRGFFRPEFVNRIDEIVVFDPLGRDEIAQIVDIQLEALQRRLDERGLTIELTDDGPRLPGEQGLRSGVRCAAAEAVDPARDPGSARARLLSGDIRQGQVVTVDTGDDGLEFSPTDGGADPSGHELDHRGLCRRRRDRGGDASATAPIEGSRAGAAVSSRRARVRPARPVPRHEVAAVPLARWCAVGPDGERGLARRRSRLGCERSTSRRSSPRPPRTGNRLGNGTCARRSPCRSDALASRSARAIRSIDLDVQLEV